MVDKAISALTEVTEIGPNDFMVVELVGGNSRRIRRKDITSEGRVMPVYLQHGTLVGDGTIALPTAPTIGNLMVLVTSGWFSGLGGYAPSGFALAGQANNGSNDGCMIWTRRVQSGDTGSYSISSSDNQMAVLYEFENAGSAALIAGGSAAGLFSGLDFTISIGGNPFDGNGIILGATETDGYAWWKPDEVQGVNIDLLYPITGDNHKSMIFRARAQEGPFLLTGSTSAPPQTPAYALFAVNGDFV